MSGRVRWLRRVAYPVVLVDLLLTTSWAAQHARTPSLFHEPLRLGRLLPWPAPTGAAVDVLRVVVLVLAAAAGALAWRRAGQVPRWLGVAVAVAYLQWILTAFSFGKVDHDRFAFLVLLAVLPTVGSRAGRDDEEAASWAVRSVQLACVLTYFLAAVAKLRFGGIEWLDSATLLRAVLRRGTWVGDLLADAPWTLHAAQYVVMGAELLSPVLLVRRWQVRAAAVAYGFHLAVFATVTIIFLPHLVAMLAFLPLERAGARPTPPPPATSGTAAARRTSSPAPPPRSR